MVRHGQAQHNVDSITKDRESSLTEEGVDQAEITSKYLSSHKFDMVITSELKRTIETADIIVKNLDYQGDIISDKLFNELGPRDLSQEIKQEVEGIIQEFNEKYKCDPIGYQENYKDKIKSLGEKFRVRETVEYDHNRIRDMIKYLENIKNKKVLLVAHSGVILDIVTDVLNLPFGIVPKGYGEKPLGNCGITIFEIDDENKWKMVLPTSTSHLECKI